MHEGAQTPCQGRRIFFPLTKQHVLRMQRMPFVALVRLPTPTPCRHLARLPVLAPWCRLVHLPALALRRNLVCLLVLAFRRGLVHLLREMLHCAMIMQIAAFSTVPSVTCGKCPVREAILSPEAA